jgi:hypothetical protein
VSGWIERVFSGSGASIVSLDLLLVSPALQAAWADRDVFIWQGRPISVVSAHGLALMKRLAGREQDWLDLRKRGLAPELGAEDE